jgi:hypothetical protein
MGVRLEFDWHKFMPGDLAHGPHNSSVECRLPINPSRNGPTLSFLAFVIGGRRPSIRSHFRWVSPGSRRVECRCGRRTSRRTTYAIITAASLTGYIVRIALKIDLLRLVGKVAPHIGDHVPHAQPKLLHERHNAVDPGVAWHGLAHANVRGRARW